MTLPIFFISMFWIPTLSPTIQPDAMTLLDEQLSGSWISQDGKIEEHWTNAKSGLMLGLNRNASREGMPFFEFMRIEQRGEDIYFVAHPKGAPGSDFKLVQCEKGRIVFENEAHDFPQVITYSRKNKDQLCAAIGTMDEREKITWCWQRSSLTRSEK